MFDVWMFLAAVVGLLIAGVSIQRRQHAARFAAIQVAADSALRRPRDFGQEREDARRSALGEEGRNWEDIGIQRAAVRPASVESVSPD